MNVNPTLSASVKGTTAMTLFSYTVSALKQKNFKEPDLLGSFVDRTFPNLNIKESKAAGWILHYSVGYAFSVVYMQALKHSNIKPTILNGFIAGAISSVPALLFWYSIFKLHPNPPKKHFKDYLGHLVLAHFVFGAFTFLGYKNSKQVQGNNYV